MHGLGEAALEPLEAAKEEGSFRWIMDGAVQSECQAVNILAHRLPPLGADYLMAAPMQPRSSPRRV